MCVGKQEYLQCGEKGGMKKRKMYTGSWGVTDDVYSLLPLSPPTHLLFKFQWILTFICILYKTCLQRHTCNQFNSISFVFKSDWGPDP